MPRRDAKIASSGLSAARSLRASSIPRADPCRVGRSVTGSRSSQCWGGFRRCGASGPPAAQFAQPTGVMNAVAHVDRAIGDTVRCVHHPGRFHPWRTSRRRASGRGSRRCCKPCWPADPSSPPVLCASSNKSPRRFDPRGEPNADACRDALAPACSPTAQVPAAPGSCPLWASCRTRTRDSPNFRRCPRGRPSIASRLRNRTGLASRGSRASSLCAVARCSPVLAGERMISLSSALREA